VIETSVLVRFPLFQDISPAILEKIAAVSAELTLKEGEAVFREGQTAEKLHFLLKGSIALRVGIMTKPDSVTVSFVSKPHQCFGWSGIVPPYHYTATAYCEEDSRILAVHGSDFMRIITDNPVDGFKIMQRVAEIISDRLRNSRQALLKTL
jgi:CRP-like cAMP-binding protein